VTIGDTLMLGKLEEEVLLAALQGHQASLASEIYERMDAIARDKRKLPAFGAVYTTLGRLTAKGFLVEKAKVDNHGRSRRVFLVSAQGQDVLNESMHRIRALGGFTLSGGSYA
jgi:DNA-binding PadR family transcriptional regulator